MAIAAIYVLVAIAFSLFGIGLNRKDPTLVLFSAILFIFSGLSIMLNGFGDLTQTYYHALGLIVICLGGYIGIRSGMDWISETL